MTLASESHKRNARFRAKCNATAVAAAAPPASKEEACARRDALVMEAVQLERQLRGASEATAAWLTDELRQRREQIAEMMRWIKNWKATAAEREQEPALPSPAPVPAPPSRVVPAPPSRVVLAAPPHAPGEPPAYAVCIVATCGCGAEVTPERTPRTWAFYCQGCGADWSHPAAPLAVKRPAPTPPRCECARRCPRCRLRR